MSHNPVQKTIEEMFEQRGYTDIETDEKCISGLDENGNKVVAYLEIIPKLNNERIEEIISNMTEQKINHALIVYTGTPTPAVKTALSKIGNLNLVIELFESLDLQFNCTKHQLVPKHIRLSHSDALEFKKKYGIRVESIDKPIIKLQIPILLRTDPIARFYNYQKGDIIKVIRKNDVIGFRLVK